MQRFIRNHVAKRARWRPLAWAAATITSAGLAAASATVFATAASAQPVQSPAPGVAPGATAIGSARYVFYTAGNGSVWQKHVTGGAATSVGGVLVSAPSPITVNNGRIMVFGEGTDHALWTTNCTPGGSCGAWTSLGGVITSKPAGVQFGTGSFNQSVYARGADGAMWARDNTPTGFAPWHFVGGRLLSGTGPCATARSGTQFVMVTGTDRGLWLDRIGGPGFSPVGGMTNATPALTNTTPTGGLAGYALGTNGAGWFENVLTPTGWRTLGGSLTSGCGGTTTGNGTPFGYALGTNGQVFENFNTQQNAWTQVTP